MRRRFSFALLLVLDVGIRRPLDVGTSCRPIGTGDPAAGRSGPGIRRPLDVGTSCRPIGTGDPAAGRSGPGIRRPLDVGTSCRPIGTGDPPAAPRGPTSSAPRCRKGPLPIGSFRRHPDTRNRRPAPTAAGRCGRRLGPCFRQTIHQYFLSALTVL
jgi:hypothetical protein